MNHISKTLNQERFYQLYTNKLKTNVSKKQNRIYTIVKFFLTAISFFEVHMTIIQ